MPGYMPGCACFAFASCGTTSLISDFDSDSFLLLADSSDRLVQLRGLLNERVVDDTQSELPRLEVVIDSHADDAEHVVDEPVDLDLEQTVYVNDSQEPPSDTADQDREQGDELLSA